MDQRYMILPLETSKKSFLAAERFTARVTLPGELSRVSFQPIALGLGDQSFPAAYWYIHEMRANGQPQFDGDNGALFSSMRISSAIMSGIDAIAAGGTLEIDASFQGYGGKASDCAHFSGGLIGFPVEPGDPDRYSGSIRFRGEDSNLILATNDTSRSLRVLHGESVWFTSRPEVAIRIKRLMIDRDWSSWQIEDIRVEDETQFAKEGKIPGEWFHPDAPNAIVSLREIPAGGSFSIRARYLGVNQRGGRFGVVAYGVTKPENP